MPINVTTTVPHVYTHDKTCELLTGATVHSASRDGVWLVLDITGSDGIRRPVHLSGRAVKARDYCPYCGEETMVDRIKDARGIEGYCQVCGKHWTMV